jgi:hypothetical protein
MGQWFERVRHGAGAGGVVGALLIAIQLIIGAWTLVISRNGGFDRVDQVIGCRGAGGEADGFGVLQPFGLQAGGALHVVDARAEFRAGLDEFAGIVAVGAAYDDHDVTPRSQFLRGALPLLGRLADSVNDSNLRIRKTAANELREVLHPRDGLRGLGSDAETRARGELFDIGFRFDKIERGKILGEAAHFNMTALADDDRVISLRDQAGDRAMRERHQRAGAFEDFEAMSAGASDGRFGGAMRGDHRGAGLDLRRIGLELNAAAAKISEDRFVVDELAQDGERLHPRGRLGEGDGVADAETHTEMFCSDNFHRLQTDSGWAITEP